MYRENIYNRMETQPWATHVAVVTMMLSRLSSQCPTSTSTVMMLTESVLFTKLLPTVILILWSYSLINLVFRYYRVSQKMFPCCWKVYKIFWETLYFSIKLSFDLRVYPLWKQWNEWKCLTNERTKNWDIVNVLGECPEQVWVHSTDTGSWNGKQEHGPAPVISASSWCQQSGE